MGKASKSTKKFQKNHLGRELTKRKHDQKKAAIREKSLAKYAPKEGEEPAGSDDEEAEAAPATVEADVFNTKAKLKPVASAAHRAATAKGAQKAYVKPAAKKAPVIEDLEVDQFMDGSFLDDDNAQIDDGALDSDDEDEEAGEDEEMSEGSDDEQDPADELAQLEADMASFESQLGNLKHADPEFYAQLKKEDKDLLNFSKDAEMAEGDDEDAEDDGTMEDDEPLPSEDQEVLTMASLKALQKQVRGPVYSLKALKKLVRIFRGAVHIGAVVDAKDASAGGKKKTQSEAAAAKEAAFRHEIAIHSPKVFHELVRFTLKEGVAVWQKHFEFDAATIAKAAASARDGAATMPTLDKHPKWNSVGPVLKAFLGHLLFFISTLRSNPLEAKMARFVLGACESLVPFFEPFPRLAQKLLKELLELWATSDRTVRVDAFLRIRQLAIELTRNGTSRGGENMLELTLKGMYLTYVRHTKFTSALTLPVIEFMANCVVEIYGIDPILSYQHAFVYIRQLAIHLRAALQVKKKDSHRSVYNWNFVNCLRVWAKVLARYGTASSASAGQNGVVAAADNLQALVYPFVQIALGTLTVLPSSRYFPLRFHVSRFLIDLGAAVKVFIPLAPHLLAVFHAAELQRKPTASTRKVNDIAHVLKASKHVIATKTYQEAVVTQALHLLLEYFHTFSYSIAFNELILPSVKLLKKHAKDIVIHRVRKQIGSFVLKLEHNASWMATKRNACEYAPKDLMDHKKGVDGIDTFRSVAGDKKPSQAASPLEKYVRIQREERKLLDETKADWNGTKTPKIGSKKKSKGSDDDEEDDEEGPKKGRKSHDDEDDDEDMDGEDDGEDDEGDDSEGGDSEDDDEDAPARKKSKSNSSAAVPRAEAKPFEYPSSDEDEAGGDLLEEMTFSDDEEGGSKKKSPAGKKKTNRGGTKHKKKSAAPTPSLAVVTKPTPAPKSASGKKGAPASGDKKRKR